MSTDTFGRYHWLPLRAPAQGSCQWFVAEEVCHALGVSMTQLKALPARCVQEMEGPRGRRIWVVSAEGLSRLLA